MTLADKGLNLQAEALEEAQTLIRLAVRDGWLKNESKIKINAKVQKIIRNALVQINLRELREAAYRSLNTFANRQYETYLREFGMISSYVLALIALSNSKLESQEHVRAERTLYEMRLDTDARGVPLQEYAKDYLENRVMPVFDRIIAQKALDPDDVSGNNSLRNRAEMEVRYAVHEQNISDLRAEGVKLVVCSVHADCSDRCAKWQGRVYSLDGTSGKTEDGRSYVPLEVARDVYYTTKAGKTYKNGLLGFNCRHTLSPYSVGMVIPHVDHETQQREQRINTRQRELERRVREQRERALVYRNIERERYLKARRLAIKANKEYIQFSKDNGRAYYPSRTKLL
ncbi:MAG: hypothetical protein J1G01_04505 [Clostridiales bacterium]|nr:hypothetical protein [Clostridiales bacterium]